MWILIIILLIVVAIDKTGFLLNDDLIDLLYVDTDKESADKKAEEKEKTKEKNNDKQSEPKEKVKNQGKGKSPKKDSKSDLDDFLDTDIPPLETSDKSVEDDAAALLDSIYKS